jgi:DNA-binding FadR family transcriptional regulator
MPAVAGEALSMSDFATIDRDARAGPEVASARSDRVPKVDLAKREHGDAAPRTSATGPVDLGSRLDDAAHNERLNALTSVSRVRKAYEQVADQIRALIISGELSAGDRLPNEPILARQFGVSRSTVREALRTLSAQSLILTAKGAGGGTYVSTPKLDSISSFLKANIGLLTEMNEISLEELLQTREHLEVFAATQSAHHRTPEAVRELRTFVRSSTEVLDPTERSRVDIDFHSQLIQMSGNRLLSIAALPVFAVLQSNLARETLTAAWHSEIAAQHEAIADAIEVGDAGQAGELTRQHIAFLRPTYVRVWRHALGSLPRD